MNPTRSEVKRVLVDWFRDNAEETMPCSREPEVVLDLAHPVVTFRDTQVKNLLDRIMHLVDNPEQPDRQDRAYEASKKHRSFLHLAVDLYHSLHEIEQNGKSINIAPYVISKLESTTFNLDLSPFPGIKKAMEGLRAGKPEPRKAKTRLRHTHEIVKLQAVVNQIDKYYGKTA